MSKPNVLCITIDGWHAGYVGAYGNTQFATPGVDRWAARGVVCDHATGAGDWGMGTGELFSPTPARAFADAGYSTIALSDDDAVLATLQSAGFAESLSVPYEAATRSAEVIEETQLFRLFAALGDAISDANDIDANGERPFFVFAHARGMNAAWDAPFDLRRQILDEDDPDPPGDVHFPTRVLPADIDPDELLGLRAAYAGQIAVLDECLAALDDLLAESGLAENTLVALVGVRGFPLGEHGIFGFDQAPLHEELLHVPWIMRFPGHEHATMRLPQVVAHADLAPTLLDACGLPIQERQTDGASLFPLIRTEAGPWRDRVCHRAGNEEAITTQAWRLRKTSDRVQLFVKPDDRWEVNDVATRTGDIAEKLAAAIEATNAALRNGVTPPPLDDELREGL